MHRIGKNLPRLAKNTALVVLAGTLAMVVIAAGNGPGAMLMLAIYIPGNILIPCLIGVIIFFLGQERLFSATTIPRGLLSSLYLFWIFAAALWLWAFLDATFLYHPDGVGTWQVFHSEFLGYGPVVVVEALLLPLLARNSKTA